MNRQLWIENLTESHCPPWACPACKTGSLALRSKSLICEETIESKAARSDEDWDAEWIRYVFSAWAACSHPSCGQSFAISGTGSVEPVYGPEGPFDLEDTFYPKSCYPMPEIIVLPDKCPDEVKSELRSAFSLFWSEPKSCAGRIRVALECLLNYLGVAKRKRNSQGKFYDLSLHARIDVFTQNEPISGTQLMALKWLGNSGSHDSLVSRDDLLDAFEILEHALAEIIDRRSKRVMKLAKTLTKKHSN